MKAALLIRETVVYPDSCLAEMVIWRVPSPVPPSRHMFKYSFVYVVCGKRVLGYDNERGKGDHRHEGETEAPFRFVSIEALLERFVNEVEALRRRA